MRSIVNAYIGQGGWYHKGAARLKQSLEDNGWTNIVQYHNEPINDVYDKDCHYTIKAAAMMSAIDYGYKSLLWLDCSMICLQHPMPLFDTIEKQGIYFETNGYTAAQECNDFSLNYYGISRDEAMNIPMVSSGMMGVDIDTEIGHTFMEMFIKAAIDGVFNGSRDHAGQSGDFRFMHHRQDQSAASLIAYKLGYKPTELGNYLAYTDGINDKTIFQCQGM